MTPSSPTGRASDPASGARHQRGSGQTVAGVRTGRSSDRQCRVDGLRDAGIGPVAGRRMAFALADVDRQAEFAILLEFQAFDRVLSDVDVEAAACGGAGFGGGSTPPPGVFQNEVEQILNGGEIGRASCREKECKYV